MIKFNLIVSLLILPIILNKIYVADYQNPLYVVFTFAIATVIGVLIYCLLTNQWNYIDIRKINNKKYFILQSLLDVSSSIFNTDNFFELSFRYL